MDNQSLSGPSPVIVLEKLSKIYRLKSKEIHALKEVTLSIHRGEFVAIVGQSGSGKSTLLQLIGALESPTSGSVIVNGVDVTKMNEGKRTRFRRENIGFIFQFFYLQPFLTLRQNIKMPLMFMKRKDSDKDLVEKIANAVGLGERLEHLPSELSGGQIQRAAIARALSNSPKIILADEPTGNLDPDSAQVILELFNKIRSDFSATIVVVTHDPKVAKYADRVITIKDGAVQL